MSSPRDLFHTSNQEKGRNIHGTKFLETAFNELIGRLGNRRIDNLYRACLLGANVGIRLMLTDDEWCCQMWGEGDIDKARHLFEVWTSSAALWLVRHDENQDSIRGGMVRDFLSLFNSNKVELEAELLVFQKTMNTEFETEANIKPDNVRICTYETLYLRTLRALNDKGVPSFRLFPAPWGMLRDMMSAYPKLFDVLDVNILLSMLGTILTQDAFLLTLKTSHECLKRLEAKG